MVGLLILFIVSAAAATGVEDRDPVQYQILNFKENTDGPIGTLTTSGGAPVSYLEATSTLHTRSVIDNEYFLDKITHVATERIPERVVHAKGTGAFGYFEVTHDISDICKAIFLSKIGKKTPVAVRFSTTQGSRGSSDTLRDTRGMAVKLYTEHGNLDLVGFNTGVFSFKDPVNFDAFVHATGRNPSTFFLDRSTFWDLATSLPASLFMFVMMHSDMGIPASYTNMGGFPIHTYQVVNDCGIRHYVRFHFIPDAGYRNLFTEEARNISSYDPDFMGRDLYTRIANGERPSWTLKVQILSESDMKKIGPVAFDVTTLIPTKDFPLHTVGKMVLTDNYNNYHAQVEQMAFCPSSLVPGIQGGPDKLFEARRLAYRHTQMYRLGGNFKKIPVNCPFQVNTHTYVRDGVPSVGDNERDAPNYYPNSFNGAEPYREHHYSDLITIKETSRPNNFGQIAEYYNELSPGEKTRLIDNLADSVGPAIEEIQKRVVKVLTIIHKEFGARLAKKLNIK